MDFIFVSLQRINTDRESTSTSLAKELAKNHNVLYVNPPIDRKSWLLGSDDEFVNEHIQNIKNNKTGIVKMEDGLWVLTPKNIIESINWIPSTSIFCVANKFNNHTFAEEIKTAIQQLGFSQFILINDKDIFRSFYLKEYLNPKLTIYLDRDYTLGFDYWKRHGTKLEPILMAKVDGVVCNSLDFTNRALTYNQNSYYISNGANLALFNSEKTWSMPEELLNLQKPIIGYVGALNSDRLDILLIQELALSLRSGTIVLIGQEDNEFQKSKLHSLANVYFIKKKITNLIPTYVSFFDVCINPQVLNDITLGNFPLKVIEYLSMGKPVVATATNTMVEIFSEHVYLSGSNLDFIKNVAAAIIEDSDTLKMSRIEFSKHFSWEKVATKLLSAIKSIEELKIVTH